VIIAGRRDTGMPMIASMATPVRTRLTGHPMMDGPRRAGSGLGTRTGCLAPVERV
jgi:hypothetical protein